ncbi:MAG TPA: 16S rRNA (cytosine(967)-C(5))-methyltransferase RsmB [Candidatus Kapabacteria bacterium]|nr:16S rRNA (cytosine(967)-C(5))-methyltransferase RsmB [Candidatus Kapabacteria bacterium]
MSQTEAISINEINDKEALYHGARGAAIRILSRFERSDSYVDKLLDAEFRLGGLNPQDKALLTELVNGVIRWQAKLDWVLTGFYHGEFEKCLTPVKNAMRVALYQVLFLAKIPHFAAINESVEVIKRIKGEKSAGIVNGVLRNVLRNINAIRYPRKEDDINWYFSVMYSHPRWMVKRWVERFGEQQTEELLKANIQRPMLTVRTNRLVAEAAFVNEWLAAHDIPRQQSQLSEDSFEVSSLRDIIATELFTQGMVSIQDASATMAARLAQAKPGNTVFDVCAAPGGKSFVLAEMMNNKGSILALDKYEQKLRFVENDAKRLGIDIIKTAVGDATSFSHEQQADIVLTDVPCSGFGTLAKKPEIKWRRELKDIEQLTKTQDAILHNAASLVKKGGVLLYSTCSIEPEENYIRIEKFLQQNPNFQLDDAANYLPNDVCKDGYMQTFPHSHNTDGAFAARLIKIS